MEHFISQEQEAREDELGAAFGDPRRCSTHGTITSSPDGMFDGLCGACEYEGEYGPEDDAADLADTRESEYRASVAEGNDEVGF